MPKRQSPLTAAEAADRIAARHQRLRRRGGVDGRTDEDSPYQCESCGCSDFIVEWTYSIAQEFEETLDCTCSERDCELAASITTRVTTAATGRGRLDDEHRVEREDDDEFDELEREVVDREVNCDECVEGASEEQWESETQEPDEGEPDNWVRCRRCNHEIEFGWSHPDFGGRIWPCESADFNPWKSWPDPRYRDAWEARGWLRPARR